MADSLIQHVFSGDRMQAFSDAVFAIMATVLVSVCACVCSGSGSSGGVCAWCVRCCRALVIHLKLVYLGNSI